MSEPRKSTMTRARLSLGALFAMVVIMGCNALPGAPGQAGLAQPEEAQDERLGVLDIGGGTCVPPGGSGGGCNQYLDGGTSRDGGTSADGGVRR